MRALYNKYFRIPQNGKISEKVMIRRVVMTAISMILCLTAMSFMAYAYFSHSITSGPHVIKTADFHVTVVVTPMNDETSDEMFRESPVAAVAGDDGSYLLPSGQYLVSLTKVGTATTGFCVVDVKVEEDVIQYHTQQLGVDGELERLTLEFTLDLSQMSDMTTVRFTPCWGTSHFYRSENTEDNERYIIDESVVEIAPVVDGGSDAEESILSSSETTDGESETIAPETEEIVYIVKSGDTLKEIANEYGVSVKRIASYNGIANSNMIWVNQQIKIPPPDWEMPADTTEQTTTQSEETTPSEITSPADTAESLETTDDPEVPTSTDPSDMLPSDETELTVSDTTTPADSSDPAETTGDSDITASPDPTDGATSDEADPIVSEITPTETTGIEALATEVQTEPAESTDTEAQE